MRLMREDSEWSIGGDCDTPYTFELPVSMPQALAWARLLAKVQNGELTPYCVVVLLASGSKGSDRHLKDYP